MEGFKATTIRTGFKIGTNLKINLDVKSKEIEMVKTEPDVKPKVKTKPDVMQKEEPDVKSNKEHKQDVKPNIELKHDVKKPDTNKDHLLGRKGCFDTGNYSCLYGMVDVQMTYPLLVFVMKYVYIKTPTPVMRAHKF